LERMCTYDEIKHTYAFDLYAQSHQTLVGHIPVSFMPLSWDPKAVKRSLRPAFRPGPIHEQTFDAAPDDDTSSISSVSSDEDSV
jgi:hypothetical protein